jgi:hypothetical protein
VNRRLIAVLAATVALAVAVPITARAGEVAAGGEHRVGAVYARITGDTVVLGNEEVERSWRRSAFATLALLDKRDGSREWSAAGRDFSLRVGVADIGSELFTVAGVEVTTLDNGLRLELDLTGPAGLDATRVVEAYEGIAGFRTQTILRPTAALALGGYTLDEVAVGATVTPTIHALRAGADWREPDWAGPPSIGDPHAGTWRDSRTATTGAALSGAAQWLSVAAGDRSLFMVMERNDQPSSTAGYDGTIAHVGVDLSRDVLSLGPLEESGHIENPTPAPGRHRAIAPGEVLALEAAFTGLATDPDDEPAQVASYVDRWRGPQARDVVFNSNGTDRDLISTGAKDDMNFEAVQAVAPIARRLGVDTFVLDDGWQAISGDWYPDSPDHPEPRWNGDPASKFAPRFPDSEFAAVREAIAPMKLGLWMSPMHFNPVSATFKAHPEWACTPVGTATAGANALQPDDGSNEAGIGTWGPDAIPHVERRIRDAIEHWGVEYFKFDFLVWLDCAGQGDMYAYRDAFVGMLDRLRADHPGVTFQIDETNDYRLFPFESVTRGPSWFQNGSPTYDRLLHNLWNLSPFVPTDSLGQHVLGGRAYEKVPVDTLMAAALPSHITLFSELRDIPAAVIDAAAPWLTFYEQHRNLLGGMAYPLLDDPLAGGWTALQPWDATRDQGSVLVFRQGATTSTKRVALRGLPADGTYQLIEAPTGALAGTATAAELRAGIDITLAAPHTAKVLLIVPVEPAEAPVAAAPSPEPRRWLAGDLHVHTCYSHDSYCGPDDDNTGPEEAYILGGTVEERFVEAAARGLDFLAITDHNDVRSSSDPGFGTHGVIGVAGYEASYEGHAQVLGARRVHDPGDKSAAAINGVAAAVRGDGGVFQINHPSIATGAAFACGDTAQMDWGYGYEVVPDTVEVWNIGHHWQAPAPSSSSNGDAIRYWECWLERGHKVGATGGSDSHWLSTAAAQGPGNPTTWVNASGSSERGILAGLREGRTSVSFQTPRAGGLRLVLEADGDGDGTYESSIGDTVEPGTAMRVRAEGLPGAGVVEVRANGATAIAGAALAPGGEVRFTAPANRATGWVRTTLSLPDPTAPARPGCNSLIGARTTYCRNPLTLVALTSPIYLAA